MPDVRPPLPPFTFATATQKTRLAEDAWNSCDPARVTLAYTPDSRWRNRSEFFAGRDAIRAFLARKWAHEHEYRLIKELWGFHENRIAVRFQYEYHDAQGQWFSACATSSRNLTPRASCNAEKPASTAWALPRLSASSAGPRAPPHGLPGADGVKAVKRRIAGITSQEQSRPASLHETGWAVGKKAILPELNTINFQTRATTARAEAIVRHDCVGNAHLQTYLLKISRKATRYYSVGIIAIHLQEEIVLLARIASSVKHSASTGPAAGLWLVLFASS